MTKRATPLEARVSPCFRGTRPGRSSKGVGLLACCVFPTLQVQIVYADTVPYNYTACPTRCPFQQFTKTKHFPTHISVFDFSDGVKSLWVFALGGVPLYILVYEKCCVRERRNSLIRLFAFGSCAHLCRRTGTTTADTISNNEYQFEWSSGHRTPARRGL